MFVPVFPKSRSESRTSLPVDEESNAVRHLLAQIETQNTSRDGASCEILLSDFTIYRPYNKHNPYDMASLQFLQTRSGHTNYLFDGTLSVGKMRRYVKKVSFKLCSIGNYGKEYHDVESKIWLQSDLNSGSTIYYRLGSCSTKYKPYHDGFLWVANLAKHFVDYLENCEYEVSINNFRSDFSVWLRNLHEESVAFQAWYKKLSSTDFRRAVVVNIAFLYKESLGVDEGLQKQHIWRELLDMDSVPEQVIQENSTIVTPFVYDCFKHMRFGHHLKAVEPVPHVKSLDLKQNNSCNALFLQNLSVENSEYSQVKPIQIKISDIKVGHVLAVTKDGNGSLWKDEHGRWKEKTEEFWYAFIHTIYYLDGKHEFEALWLYRPSDTCCAKMKYPFANELFLSDNCTCKAKVRIKEGEVLGVVPVKWQTIPPKPCLMPFVRQTYVQNERFETLKSYHKICHDCSSEKKPSRSTTSSFESQYPIGQPVLVPPYYESLYDLEVYEVAQYISENNQLWVLLRILRRRLEVDGQGKPNELVYTDQYERKLSPYRIKRKCLVRIYTESEVSSGSIPAPYSRGGAGHAFYISKRLVTRQGKTSLKPIETCLPKSLLQGFDPSELPQYKLLRGMDLYCGAGNFGRGLEEGGAVCNKYAVDINKQAIHTYSANLRCDSSTKLYYGSVNDLLLQALQGNPQNSDLIPLPGDVDFISAGSPCQGFSTLNQNPNNENGLKNQSMVASVAAYIDFYRPKYGLLENVMAIAQTGRGRDEDALSQLISAVVGMGYQLQLFVVDAWSCGNPQSRTRLFVSFVAPGLELLNHPVLSHSHPPNVTDRGLGQLANGQPFGRRLHELTAFHYVSAAEATKDLPNIGNGQTNHCTEQPDHIVSIGVSRTLQAQIDAIPRSPPGMNFRKAWERGYISSTQRDLFPRSTRSGRLPESVGSSSVAWGRVNPNRLFSAIVVHLTPADSRGGAVLHWDYDRPLTTMEGRRAQGFPDDELLLGSRREAWKLLGNSVARNVAVSLGLSLREAWLKCNFINDPEPTSALVWQKTSELDILRAGKLNDDELQSECQMIDPISHTKEPDKNHGTVSRRRLLTSSSCSEPERSYQCVAAKKARRTRPSHEMQNFGSTSIDQSRTVHLTESAKGTRSIRIQKSARKRLQTWETADTMGSDDELSLDMSDVRFRTPVSRTRSVATRPWQNTHKIPDSFETALKKDLKRAFPRSDCAPHSSAVLRKLRRATFSALPARHTSLSRLSLGESGSQPGLLPVLTQQISPGLRQPVAMATHGRHSSMCTGPQTPTL